MTKHLNELIDSNLKLICKTKKGQIYSHRFVDIEGWELNSPRKGKVFSIEMESRGLIRKMDELCIVTELGNRIYESGGWLNYIGLLKKKEDLENERDKVKEVVQKAKEDVKTQKFIDDAKVSRFNAKYRYLPFVFTGIGVAISIISLIIALKSKKEPITEKQLSKSEVLKIIDSISSSIQTKKVDSLRNSKILNDSLKN